MPGRELAEHGYVDADIPPELRTGRTPQYSVQRRRVIEDAGALRGDSFKYARETAPVTHEGMPA
ncbi:hypothetical protein GCM10022383_29200 [Microbacterium soli]|uniref:Uncharacterized protein n=1 Tax=Microbacterium soli TaxID=446075 RepID=A0ABP7NLL8_9MICO